MPTESNIWEILPGAATTTPVTVTLIDPESSGTTGLLQTLTHPDGTNFPPVTFAENPIRMLGFDQVPLHPPTSSTIRTLDTTQVFVTQNALDDVTATLIWPASDRRTTMIASFFRRLYELSINPPALTDPETFIVWAPLDRTTSTYNVIISSIRVGGAAMDLKEIGLIPAGVLDTVATGLVDRTVELDLKIVSQAS